jgi:diguanylate cyclase (GGDEF)-like protein
VAIGLAVVLILLWIVVACSFVFRERESRIDHYVETEAARIEKQAETISANFGRSLGYLAGVPLLVANNSLFKERLKQLSEVAPEGQDSSLLRNRWSKDSRFSELNHHLQLMAQHLDVDLIWVMNDKGYCIASNKTGEGSPIGTQFADRRYFSMAKRQGYGRQYAAGRTTHLPGLYFSYEIRDENGRFLGVAAAKRNVSRLAHLIENSYALVTDEMGVVILSTDPALLMNSMPDSEIGAQPEDVRRRRYHRESFPRLNLRHGPNQGNRGLFFLGSDSVPLLMTTRSRLSENIHIHVFSRLSTIGQIESDSRWMSLVLSLAGSLSILLSLSGVLFINRSRRQKRVLQEMNSMLQQQAYTDQLTGCLNRRRWLELAALSVDRANRYGRPLSLLMLDLDHFKEVNDRFGHPAGDEVLRCFAKMVQQKVRRVDSVGRLGGEEFSILLPETTLEMAEVLAERIRASMQNKRFRFSGREVAVTVSLGVAQYEPEQPLSELLQQADDALYEAKHRGRNRVYPSINRVAPAVILLNRP